MPYIPPPAIDPTVFPQPYVADLTTHIGLIEERWRRSFPIISYTMIDKRVTAVADSPAGTGAASDALSGEAGSTKFDPLWGESIDSTLTTWQQPHGQAAATPAIKAVEPNVYLPAIPLHARIRRAARKDELQKYGFDRIRDLLVTIPTSMLDTAGVTCAAGDRFVWNNELFEVIQWSPMGWWFQTSVKLYIVLNVQHARRGS